MFKKIISLGIHEAKLPNRIDINGPYGVIIRGVDIHFLKAFYDQDGDFAGGYPGKDTYFSIGEKAELFSKGKTFICHYQEVKVLFRANSYISFGPNHFAREGVVAKDMTLDLNGVKMNLQKGKEYNFNNLFN